MEVGKLTVEVRTVQGKNESQRLRNSGKVPGVCYGKGIEVPLLLSLDPKQLKKALDPTKRQNTVIQMTVTGAGAPPREITVMLKDYQYDRMRREVEHVDLLAIDVNQEVRVEVPIVLTGKAVGVVDGGQLHAVYRLFPVICKPADIPAKIEADITALGIGDALHVSDLKLPAGVKAGVPGTEAVASVVAPKAEKVEAVVEEVAAEGAAPAAGAPAAAGAAGKDAAAAAPAAGAKGGDKGAAAKPAKEEKKK